MKTAFVSGASSGFGSAIAKELDKENFKLILLARRKDRLDNLSKELKNVHIICCDVRDNDELNYNLEKMPDDFKKIDVLVNNAGLALGCDNIEKSSVSDFDIMIDTNTKGLVYVTKAILPFMKEGYIFNISSVASRWPYFGSNVYGATKAFVSQFGLNLRCDLAGKNIRVTNIEPGLAKTEFSKVRFKGDDKKADSIYENTEFLHPEDVAQVIINCINLPKRININTIELMPISQSFGGLTIKRKFYE